MWYFATTPGPAVNSIVSLVLVADTSSAVASRGDKLPVTSTDAAKAEDARTTERVRAKGDISRHRTIVQDEAGAAGMPAAGAGECVRGRVIRVHGLASVVEADDGRVFRCAVRRLLKSLATDERSVVTTGDVVWVRPASGAGDDAALEGMIERVEPRHGGLTRASRRR